MRWLYLNGEIVGVEKDGIEYNVIAIMRDTELHSLYHIKLKEDKDAKETFKR